MFKRFDVVDLGQVCGVVAARPSAHRVAKFLKKTLLLISEAVVGKLDFKQTKVFRAKRVNQSTEDFPGQISSVAVIVEPLVSEKMYSPSSVSVKGRSVPMITQAVATGGRVPFGSDSAMWIRAWAGVMFSLFANALA